MENQELGNPETLTPTSDALTRREFLKKCYEGGKKVAAASFASGVLGLFTWRIAFAPDDDHTMQVIQATTDQVTTDQVRSLPANAAETNIDPQPKPDNLASSRTNPRLSISEKDIESTQYSSVSREAVTYSGAQFVDRLNRSFLYSVYGLNKNHTAFYVDSGRKILYPRRNTIILAPGIDFSGIDDQYREWERWIVATAPTTTAEKIEKEFTKYKSPLKGLGKFVYDLGLSYGVDPNFFTAICFLESNYATVDSVARKRLNTGSLRHSPLSVGEIGRFADFPGQSHLISLN